MGQFADCIEGMAEACRALDFPVVSGNVSLYNETNGTAIPPTPTIGGVGVLTDVDRMATIGLRAEGHVLLLLGGAGGAGLGQSLYLREIEDRDEGAPPPVDLAAERRTGDFVRALIEDGRVRTCHDVACGGLLVAVAEMALAGGIGATVDRPDGLQPWHRVDFLFGEAQGRYVIAVDEDTAAAIAREADTAGLAVRTIGRTGGRRLTVADTFAISIEELRSVHERWLPDYMSR
jgi:phosphoribosylformylglycinamidine synthase